MVHGDVAGLRALARAMTAAATPVSSAGSTTDGRLSGLVQHGWRGDAANAMAGRWATQRPRFDALAGHLAAVGRALEQYATTVESAQRLVGQGRAAAAAAGLMLDLDGNASLPSYVLLMPPDHQASLRVALQAAQRADLAALDLAQSAEAALLPALHGVLQDLVTAGKPEGGGTEAEPPSVPEQIDHLNRMLGWLLSPVATGLAVREGQVWTTALTAWRAAPAALQAGLFSDIVSPVALQFDRGEATLAELAVAVERFSTADDAVYGFARVFNPSGFEDLKTGGVPEVGALGVASKVFAGLGVLSDVGVLINPGVRNHTEAGLDRTAAGLNLAGTAAVFAPEGVVTAAAGVVGLDAAVGWVPVAGQVVVVASGLYLAGDWAYNNLQPFHDAVDATGTAIADGATAVWHAGGDVVDGAAHVAGDVAHALNPLNW